MKKYYFFGRYGVIAQQGNIVEDIFTKRVYRLKNI